jgi:hypothetical protein
MAVLPKSGNSVQIEVQLLEAGARGLGAALNAWGRTVAFCMSKWRMSMGQRLKGGVVIAYGTAEAVP